MSRVALTRLFPDGKTVFIPADGQPMQGYDQARAEIEARGGEVQVASADNSSAGGGLFSWLVGAKAGGADDEEEGSGVEAAPTARGGRAPVPAAAQVAGADAPREAPASAAAPQPTPTPDAAEANDSADAAAADANDGDFPAPLPPRKPVELILADAPTPPARPTELAFAPAADTSGDRDLIAALLVRGGLPRVITRGVGAPRGILALTETDAPEPPERPAILDRAAALAAPLPPLPPTRNAARVAAKPTPSETSAAAPAKLAAAPAPAPTARGLALLSPAQSANPYGDLVTDGFAADTAPSPATQLGCGLEDLDLGRASIEPAMEESAAQELVAASLAVGARVRVRIVVTAVLIGVGVAILALVQSGLFRPLVLRPRDHLLLTVIQNKTADKMLDGTVMEGLEIALRQSGSLNVLGGEAYRAGLRQIQGESGDATTAAEQKVAQKVGARAYLYGEIKGLEAPYTISVDVLKTNSNDKVATLEETAASREEIPAAIGRMAQDIRIEVSEDDKAEAQNSVPFGADATAKVNALHAYAVGQAAMQDGRGLDALAAYQQAAQLDPKFVQAQIALAWLYRSERAEVASANAAELARSAAANASEKMKLLAQFCYEMNASGDYDRAVETIRGYVAGYPLDVDGMQGLARALRAQGLLPEALLAAQQGYSEHPFDAEAYSEAELAMIGMDRYDNALQLQTQAERVGVVSKENALIAGYLSGKDDIVATQVSSMQGAIAGIPAAGSARVTYANLYGYGVYLDNTGRTAAGLELWRTAAARAGTVPELASTQASMLAQGALDRALTESCTVALAMVYELKNLPKGPVASFNAAMAAALCGDQPYAERAIAALHQGYPQNTAVTRYYLPQLQAAAELGVNQPAKAMQSLISLGQYDLISLTPYLRGMAHAALGQMPSAILDFQMVQTNRGAALMLKGDVYPMAELSIARAYGAVRDKTESVRAYRRFLMLWGEADRRQPLIAEALANSK